VAVAGLGIALWQAWTWTPDKSIFVAGLIIAAIGLWAFLAVVDREEEEWEQQQQRR
jgi:hypothetical protein